MLAAVTEAEVPLLNDELVVTRGASGTLRFTPRSDAQTAASTEKLRRMFALREDLERAGAVRPLELRWESGQPTLVCADPGGTRLSELTRGAPVAIALALEVGVAVARALARFHECALVHRDLKPENVWVSPSTGEAWLAGTGLTLRTSRSRHGDGPRDLVLGTFAYMAPEQTGRLNRSVDARSDLYALGVVLYELLTARLPFVTTNAAQMLHAHVAREPVPPLRHRDDIPLVVSRIVEKLLSKSADGRYQTASGLASDLAQCLERRRSHGAIEVFPLGARDRAHRSGGPALLFGREGTTELLDAAWGRVARSGEVELVLVRGWSGVGKSAVVHALRGSMAERAFFCSGKFDARRGDVPYATLIDGLTELVRHVLCLPELELAPWRDAILAGVGGNGALVTSLIPDLETIVGRQPAPPETSASEARLRLHHALVAFIGVFASEGRPVTIFLDDLQWLDPATLDFLEYVLTKSDARHLLLLGAYRDNEVDAAHPLRRCLDGMIASGARVTEVDVGPLGVDQVAELIASTLQESPGSLRPLAELITAKTHGNPFFALQLVASLVEEELLTYSPDGGSWQWSLDAIRARRLTDDVAALVAGRISRLSEPARKLLERFACLDTPADHATLGLIGGTTPESVASSIEEAATAGLVVPSTGGHRFAHDRVSEAAYALVPPDRREASHLDIARRLHAAHGPSVEGEAVFAVVGQYNRALRLVETSEERRAVAALELSAARRARSTTAYASALSYASTGSQLLAGDHAPHDPALSFALGLLQAECRLLTGEVAAAERQLAAMAEAETGPVDRAAVTCLQIDLYTLLDRSDLGVGVALRYLASVGIHWSAHPSRDHLDDEYGRFHREIVAHRIERFAELPHMSDPAVQATMDVLTRMQVPAMFSDENLGGMVLARMANLSVAHGNGHGSCFAYGWLAGFAGAHLGDADSARKLADLATRLVEHADLGRYRARVLCLLGYLVTPWIAPLGDGRSRLLEAHEAARAAGDVTFMSYTSNHLVTLALGTGDALDELEAQIVLGREQAQKAQFGLVTDFFTGQLRLVRALRGCAPVFVAPTGSEETELDFEARMLGDPLRAIAACWYWIRKLQAQYHEGALDQAEASAERAGALLWTSTADFELAEYHFFAALVCTALATTGPAERATGRIEAARLHHARLAAWARGCPANFAHRAALVAAEIARVEGDPSRARQGYDDAVRLAREGAFHHHVGLGHELAARFHAARGDEASASMCRRLAGESYRRWGATALASRIAPQAPAVEAVGDLPAIPPATGWSVEQMDLATIITALQSVSSEIELDRLLHTILAAAAEHAGAQRVVLVLADGGELRVVAEGVSGESPRIHLAPLAVAETDLPAAVFRYVARTRATVNLADPDRLDLFRAELARVPAQPRSLLCLPLLVRASFVGLLHLEHGSIEGAFTPSRIQVVRLLASQAATALENARLYAELKRENAERRRAEAVLAGEKDVLQRIAEGHALPDVMASICDLARRCESDWSVEVRVRDAGGEADQIVAASGPRHDERFSWSVPIMSPSGVVLGCFVVAAPLDERGPGRRALVEQLTHLAAVAIEHARKRDELLVSEERFRQFADALPEVVWITDLAPERVVYCSPSFERIWGHSVADLLTQPRLWTDTIHPEDRARVAEKFSRWVEGDEAKYEDVEFRIVRPDGGIRWIREIGVVSKNRQGVPYRVGGIASDITSQKLADEAQQRAQAELAHLSRVATMGELTASIAHEVSQPLAAIVTSAGAGARWLKATPPDLERARETLARIARDGSRATDVVVRLRALFRKTDLTRETFLVADLVRDVEGFVCGDLRRRRITLEIHGSEPAEVSGSRVQVQQVLLNLVLNAMEAIEAGSGADPVIAIGTAVAEPGFVEIIVRDTGVGLDAEPAERLFEAFYTTKTSGMGMGLSVARTIVEAHGGRIVARANDGAGATIAFTLPLAATS